MGVALGLANALLKRCAAKGLVKIQNAPARRYAYYLTPKGFAEKSRLVAEYLEPSLHFFRGSRSQRSEGLRVGKDCVSTCISWWAPFLYKKQEIQNSTKTK